MNVTYHLVHTQVPFLVMLFQLVGLNLPVELLTIELAEHVKGTHDVVE